MWNVAVHVNIVQANFNVLESSLKIHDRDYTCKIFLKMIFLLFSTLLQHHGDVNLFDKQDKSRISRSFAP